jgi:hypothetical protein
MLRSNPTARNVASVTLRERGLLPCTVELIRKVENPVLLKLVLEQSIDEEHFTARELGPSVLASDLYSSDRLPSLLHEIRHWLETTEGDGFLDLTGHGPPF